MKILSVTDSHGRLDFLIKMWEKEKPDIVFCTGDYTEDVVELSYIYPQSEYYIVRGNCDFGDYNNQDRIKLEVGKNKFFLTHGHLYGVKRDYNYLELEVRKEGVNYCIFGHTHIPYLETKDGVTFFNPGAARDKLYGVIEIVDDKVKIEKKVLEG